MSSRRLHLAVFTSEDALFDALHACRDRHLTVVDVRSPYPIHGVDELAGIPRSRLPGVCLAGGVAGLVLALWFQYWSSMTDWPIDVGGKPWDSLPAFAPVAFEMTVLLAGLAVVFGLLLRSRLLPGRKPTFTDLRITDDRFVLLVTRPDAAVSDRELAAIWEETGAVETRQLMEPEASR